MFVLKSFHDSTAKVAQYLPMMMRWNHIISCISYILILYSAAAGLYYLAELVEEYSVLAKKILVYLLAVSDGLVS